MTIEVEGRSGVKHKFSYQDEGKYFGIYNREINGNDVLAFYAKLLDCSDSKNVPRGVIFALAAALDAQKLAKEYKIELVLDKREVEEKMRLYDPL